MLHEGLFVAKRLQYLHDFFFSSSINAPRMRDKKVEIVHFPSHENTKLQKVSFILKFSTVILSEGEKRWLKKRK